MKIVRDIVAGVIVGLLFFSCVATVQAAPISSIRDVVSRTQTSVAVNHTIYATIPTTLTSVGDYIRITFPVGFVVPALTPSDISLSYGPVTGLETVATLGATSGSNTWGVFRSGNVLTFVVPTNEPIGGLPAGSKVIISIGTQVSGVVRQITNPPAAGVYPLIIGTPFEEATFSVQIVSDDTITVSATVTAPSSPPGGETTPSGGGASGGDPVPPPVDTAFVISGLRVEDIHTDHATIAWETTASADSRVEYGETVSYGGLASEGTLTRTHRMTITGLTADRSYFVRARSQTSGGTSGTGTISFRTSMLPHAPVISHVRLTSVTDRSAVLLFDTDIDARSTITYASMAGVSGSVIESGFTRTHSITLTGLRPMTSYSGGIVAEESTGLHSDRAAFSLSTAEDRTPPSNPSSITAIGITGSIRLDWIDAALEDGDYFVLRASTIGPPLSVTDGRLVYSGRSMSVTDSGLLDDTVYYYTLFAVDSFGNPSSGIVASARTLRGTIIPPPIEPLPPVITPVPPTVTPPPPTPLDPGIRPTPGVVTPGAGATDGPTPTVGAPGATGAPTPGATGVATPGTGISGTSPESTSTLPTTPLTPTTEPAGTPLATLVPLVMDEAVSATTTQPVSSFSEQTQVHIYVAHGALELLRVGGLRTVLPGRPMLFRLSVWADGEAPTGGQLRVDGTTYLLVGRPGEGTWETTLVAPAEIRDTNYEILLQYADGSRRHEVGVIRTRPFGIVREGSLLQRDQTPVVAGATIEILRTDGSRWEASAFEQQNPSVTGEAGTFGFLLPQGSYRLRVSKAGFRTFERVIDVSDQVLALPVSLTKELLPLGDILRPDASIGQNAQAVLREASIAAQILRDVSETQEVQQATKTVAAPAAAVATVAVTATAVSSVSALNYARFLFTQPLLLVRRRRRKKWGTIYNALSKQPIELAIVRLVHAASGVVVQTRITDALGRYSFSVLPGQYRVQVLKPNFVYPSTYLKAEKEDGDFLDLYHGELITTKEGALLTPNIPIDPVVREETPASIVWRGRLRRAQSILGVVGTIVSVASFAVAPSVLTGGLFALQVASYALFRRLALPPKPKDWGIAYDQDSKQPLERAVIRVFDKKFNKLLETQVTDQKGKYGFFAAKGVYYLTAEKLGYEKFVSQDIDLRQAKETVIDQHVALTKQKK